jgi:tripartite-type tricarboxylate transporter receptor subunit TctC
MARTLGQPIVIVHQPGATGQIGAAYVKAAEADGYTLLYANLSTHALSPVVEKNLRYNPWGDFAPVILAAQLPTALLVRDASNIRTLDDLKALAKTKGDLTLGTIGAGSASLFLGIMLEEVVGIKVRPIQYKGEALAVQDVIGGHIDMIFAATAPQFIGPGAARPILTTGTERWKAIPGVPTLAEATGTQYSMTAWNGVVAPKATPKAVITRLNQAANKALADPEVRERLEKAGIQVVGGTPELFEQRSRKDILMLEAFAKRHAATIDALR